MTWSVWSAVGQLWPGLIIAGGTATYHLTTRPALGPALAEEGDFQLDGGTCRTPGYAESANQLDLVISGGIGEVRIEGAR